MKSDWADFMLTKTLLLVMFWPEIMNKIKTWFVRCFVVGLAALCLYKFVVFLEKSNKENEAIQQQQMQLYIHNPREFCRLYGQHDVRCSGIIR